MARGVKRLLITNYFKGIGNKLVSGAINIFALKILGALFWFVSQVLLARMYGVSEYGRFIYALTLIFVVSILIKFGFQSCAIRFISIYKSCEDWAKLKALIFSSLITPLALGLLLSFFLFALYSASLILEDFSIRLVLIVFIGLVLYSVLGNMQGILQGFKRPFQSLVSWQVTVPVCLILGALINNYQFPNVMNSEMILINLIIALFFSVILSSFFIFLPHYKKLSIVKAEYHISEWLSVAFPLMLVASSQLLLRQIDVLMIGQMMGYSEAGIYSVVSRVSDLLTFGLVAVNTLASPKVAQLHHSNNIRELQLVCMKSAQTGFFFTAVTALGLMVFGQYILNLFGGDFSQGYASLLVLMGAQLFSSACGLTGVILGMTGYQIISAKILLSSVVLNVILNYYLIPLFGIIGAAISTAITMVYWNAVMVAFISAKLNINSSILFSNKKQNAC